MVCVKQLLFQRSQSFALLIRPSEKVMDGGASGVFQEHEEDPRSTTEALPSVTSERVILGCTKDSAQNHCGFSSLRSLAVFKQFERAKKAAKPQGAW